MTQIKSEKAKAYLSSTAMHPNSPLAQDQYLVWRDKSILEAILIAETESEERHAKELQELKDKAVEAFCKGMCDERECRSNHGKCTRFKEFTQKLNEQ